MKPPFLIIQAEQQVLDCFGSCPIVDAPDDAIDGAPQLKLPHRPLAWTVGKVQTLSYDTIQTMPHLAEPGASRNWWACRLRQQERRVPLERPEHRLQRRSPLLKGAFEKRTSVGTGEK